MRKIFVVSVAGLWTAGCTYDIAEFTVVSTKNVPISSGLKTVRVKGESIKTIILGFPVGEPKVEEAVSDALKGNKVLLLNAKIYGITKYFAFAGSFGYEVVGDAVVVKEVEETK